MYPIHYASIVGNKEIIEIILSKSNVEINRLTEPFGVSSSAFYTPLHIAASNENLQAVLTLLIHKAKADDVSNKNRNNALHCSMRNTDLRIAEALLSYDTNLIFQENKNVKRPLDLAALFHNEPMHSFLLDVLNLVYKILPFESIYLKYSDTKDIDEKQKVTDQVVLLLSEKIESQDTDNQKDDGEEEEEEEGQLMDNPNSM